MSRAARGGPPLRVPCPACEAQPGQVCHEVVLLRTPHPERRAEPVQPSGSDLWCHLPAPTAEDAGGLCVRLAGHAGPGLYCTARPDTAQARDAQEKRTYPTCHQCGHEHRHPQYCTQNVGPNEPCGCEEPNMKPTGIDPQAAKAISDAFDAHFSNKNGGLDDIIRSAHRDKAKRALEALTAAGYVVVYAEMNGI